MGNKKPSGSLRKVWAILPCLALPLLLWGLSFGVAFGAEEELDGLPQFEAHTFSSQLFWLVVSFCIFFYLVVKFFAPKMESKLSFRKNIIMDNQKTAEKLLQDSKMMEEKLEQSLTTAKQRARQDMTTTNEAIAQRRDSALMAFQNRADDMLVAAQKNLDEAWGDLQKDKKNLVDDLAKTIGKKILEG